MARVRGRGVLVVPGTAIRSSGAEDEASTGSKQLSAQVLTSIDYSNFQG